uniref:Uncharacterized protein LOC104231130 n=1 Tax=Nicotiana sylvestris TaxID=4096 RepID=A0A1U7WYK4_NICSY|nr:PREDICTED: uncharacterized protein LOC104231130 [Nicotiana sylvestris]XP_009782386.1 PREDICTED: uncharacterized protein LOC104231130 [Nicotiana sylvestris]XP_009782396.1 PREDICTED: uncharacterized protein LOC104231130 [Nicotiana sylvestris]XP_009782404.1 PREDICTED: uncharacterized protein LOC104231130 [Nicotiana sylvestris]
MTTPMRSSRWGYVRIITGTILGGILGFYAMHRAELKYKEMWNERLKKYEEELKMKQSTEMHTPTVLSGDPLPR